jgi:hypothetical protein
MLLVALDVGCRQYVGISGILCPGSQDAVMPLPPHGKSTTHLALTKYGRKARFIRLKVIPF